MEAKTVELFLLIFTALAQRTCSENATNSTSPTPTTKKTYSSVEEFCQSVDGAYSSCTRSCFADFVINKNRQESLDFCRSLGSGSIRGRLAHLKNSEIHQFAKGQCQECFIGLYAPGGSTGGPNNLVVSDWFWDDVDSNGDETLEPMEWYSNPIDVVQGWDCMALWINNRRFNDVLCSASHPGALCEFLDDRTYAEPNPLGGCDAPSTIDLKRVRIYNYHQGERSLPSSVFEEFSTADMSRCGLECFHRSSSCDGFNYNQQDSICQLYSVDDGYTVQDSDSFDRYG